MPERTYMKVDPRRDHSFVIPRPDLSRTFGTPNAWAAEIMDKWYGTDWRIRQSPTRSQRAANGNQTAIEALRGLVNDQDQAGIVSGSAIVRIGRLGSVGLAADILTASADADPLVRLGAAEAAANLPPVHRLEAIGDLLSDEIRALRIAAATALCSTSPDLFGNQRESFEKAAEDLRTYVDTNADVAETQSNFGFFLFGQQRISEAEAAFQRANFSRPCA